MSGGRRLSPFPPYELSLSFDTIAARTTDVQHINRRCRYIHFVNDPVNIGLAPMQKLPQARIFGHARAPLWQGLKAEYRLFHACEPQRRLR